MVDSPGPLPIDQSFAYVETIVPHYDKLARRDRAIGERFHLPERSAIDRMDIGVVKILERNLPRDPAAVAGRGLETKPAAPPERSLVSLKTEDLVKLADGYGIDVKTLTGTGRGGKVTREDIATAISAAKARIQT